MEITQRIASILSRYRYEAGVSQEEMALALGVSKNSIVNYEKGLSSPKLSQLIKWFEVLGVNLHRPLMEMIYPELYHNISAEDSDIKILSAVQDYINTLNPESYREVAYIFLGEHGSDPNSLLQLFTAYLHLPLQLRVSIARSIFESYEMLEKQNKIVCPNHILPNKDKLHEAIESGKVAAIDGKLGYNN